MCLVSPLTPDVVGRFKEVRNHAVKCLSKKVSDEKLNLVSLQLI